MPSWYGTYEKQQGIKAVSRRGPFGQGWLALAWNDLVESGDRGGGALNRGRSLARNGSVQSIAVTPGTITGWVQERGQLYQVLVTLPGVAQQRWERFFTLVRHEPLVRAQLLGGQVPAMLGEGAFAALVPLVPRTLDPFEMHCGCYSWETPCKHAAAIFFLVAEELDRDPRLIFIIRGLDLATLIHSLRRNARVIDSGIGDAAQRGAAAWREPLPNDLAAFWHGTPPDPIVPKAAPLSPAPHLTSFPFWSGSRPFADMLEPIYEKAAREARDLLRMIDASD